MIDTMWQWVPNFTMRVSKVLSEELILNHKKVSETQRDGERTRQRKHGRENEVSPISEEPGWTGTRGWRTECRQAAGDGASLLDSGGHSQWICFNCNRKITGLYREQCGLTYVLQSHP